MLRTLKIALLVSALTSALLPKAQAKNPVIGAMGELEIVEDLAALKLRVISAKRMGNSFLTVDVWRGVVETQSNGRKVFDYSSYYDKVFKIINDEGLLIAPILSNHIARIGNIGDNVNIGLPAGSFAAGPDSQHQSSSGELNDESASVWDFSARRGRREFAASFAEHYKGKKDWFYKVYLGMGPAGELRYPSYSGRNWKYPGIGEIQAYSAPAISSFRAYLKEKYGSMEKLNAGWGTVFHSFSELGPPTDGERFWIDGVRTQYGRDFLFWYQKSLLDHLRADVTAAREAFGPDFTPKIAVKLAGMHWLMNHDKFPHAAEYAAGYYDYEEIFKVLGELKVAVTFTCLEMSNRSVAPEFSLARDLVRKTFNLAVKYHVEMSVENARAMDLNPESEAMVEENMKNIVDAFSEFDFESFTFLRINSLVNHDGSYKPLAVLFQKYLTQKPEFQDANLKDSSGLYQGCVNILRKLLANPSVGGSRAPESG